MCVYAVCVCVRYQNWRSTNNGHLFRITGILNHGNAELDHVTREHFVRLLLLGYGAVYAVVVDESAIAALIVLEIKN